MPGLTGSRGGAIIGVDQMKGSAYRPHIPMKNIPVRSIVRISVCAALLAVCSWISLPFAVPFTLQTFGVFITLILCGGLEGTLAILVYILLGALGAPVFAGFEGGVQALLGPTGGYIFGFLITGVVRILFDKLLGRGKAEIPALAVGLAACYIAGTIWFISVMNGRGGDYTFGSALMTCVVPFILPDLAKLALALLIGGRLKKLGLANK